MECTAAQNRGSTATGIDSRGPFHSVKLAPAMDDLAPGLYVVATPIGNLGDLSERAAAVLRAATVIAAEDTRVFRALARRTGAAGTVLSLTEHNVAERAPSLLEAARGSVVALTSDAGTPLIADPGARLVAEAHRQSVPVFAVPGPSALAAALSVSGFDASDVHFLGFLPRPAGQRRSRLAAAAAGAATLAFFESPRRLSGTLHELAELLDDPEVAVCRELTKLYEETVRGRASTLAGRFAGTRGECVVVVDTSAVGRAGSEEEVEAYLAEMARAGARRAAAAAVAARRFGIPRREAYDLWPASEEERSR